MHPPAGSGAFFVAGANLPLSRALNTVLIGAARR